MRLIFGLFLEGLTPCAIAKELTRRGILTVTGRAKWNAATINGVLANEKYTGCARIQKTFTPDFLTKKVVKNTGQVPSYFVEQSHPAIIEPAVFDMVQAEMARRTKCGRRYSGVSIFSGKIKCGECGGFFGAIRTLEAQTEPVAEFDERLWGAMVDYVTVGADKRLTVVFRDGTESVKLCV